MNQEHGEPELKRIGAAYVDDLELSIKNETGTMLNLYPLRAKIQKTILPTRPFSASETREALKKIPYEGHTKYLSDRLNEMAMLADQGQEFKVEPVVSCQPIRGISRHSLQDVFLK